MVAVTVYLAAFAAVLGAAYLKFIYRRRREGEPAIVPGNLLFGSGPDFAKQAVNFLIGCRERFGQIFTIRLLNQYVTILMDPHSYENFVKEKAFTFDPIQRQVNTNVFSFELIDAHKMLSEAGKKVNGRYLHKGMTNFHQNLCSAFDKVTTLDVDGASVRTVGETWGQDGLRSLTSKTIFSALFYTIFGHGPAAPEFEPHTFYKNFDGFHKYFNYLWLGLPVKMFPKALDNLKVLSQQPSSEEMLEREGLSDYIKFATEFMKEQGQSETDIVGHNLVFLHVNYNTFRLAFWCLYQLLIHPASWKALADEVHEIVEAKEFDTDDAGRIVFTMEDIDRLPMLDSVIKETLRLTSGVFMVRYVSQDVHFEMNDGSKHLVRQGDRVAIYPPAIHMDPEIFEDPKVYKHDRFVDAKFYKNGRELKTPIIPFGSLCPGKRFSMLQAKWFLLNFVYSFDLQLLEGEETKPDVNYYGHEILPPTNDVQVRYRLNGAPKELTFAPRRPC